MDQRRVVREVERGDFGALVSGDFGESGVVGEIDGGKLRALIELEFHQVGAFREVDFGDRVAAYIEFGELCVFRHVEFGQQVGAYVQVGELGVMRYVELGDGVAVTGQKGERGEILDSGHRSDSAAQQLVQLVHIDFRYPLGLFQREDAVVVGVEITYFLAIIQESGVGDLIEDVQLAFYEFRPDGDVFRRHGERRQAGRFIRKLHAAALDDPAAEGIAVVGDGREGDRCAFLRFGYGPAVAPRFAVAALTGGYGNGVFDGFIRVVFFTGGHRSRKQCQCGQQKRYMFFHRTNFC